MDNNSDARTSRQVAKAEYYKRRKAQFRELGLCLDCGRNPARPNRTTCEVCAARHRAVSKLKYMERLQQHICQRCRCELPEGYYYVTCPECREQNRVYLTEYNKRVRQEKQRIK